MIILYFIIGLVLSFLGSIPIGLITLTITQRTIEKGRTSGLMIALGATIMEFVYTFIALISLDFFSNNDMIGQYIKIFATVLFLGMGAYYFFKKNTASLKPVPTYDYFDFLRGVDTFILSAKGNEGEGGFAENRECINLREILYIETHLE